MSRTLNGVVFGLASSLEGVVFGAQKTRRAAAEGRVVDASPSCMNGGIWS